MIKKNRSEWWYNKNYGDDVEFESIHTQIDKRLNEDDKRDEQQSSDIKKLREDIAKISGGTKPYDDKWIKTKFNDVDNKLSNKAEKSEIPTKISQLSNDSGFITEDDVPTKVSELENDEGFLTEESAYTRDAADEKFATIETVEDIEYVVSSALNNLNERIEAVSGDVETKADADSVYTKEEIDGTLESYATKKYVDDEISLISGKTIEFKIVDSLPESGETNIIYLVPKSKTSEKNIYDEYVWIKNDGGGHFEKIGSTEIDLSEYLKIADAEATYATKNELSSVEDEVEEVKDSLDGVKASVAEVSGKTEELDEELETVKDSIDEISENLDELSAKTSASTESIEALSGKIETVESAVEELEGNMYEAFELMDEKIDIFSAKTEGAIEEITSAVTALSGQVEELKDEVEDLKVNAYASLEKVNTYLYKAYYDELDYDYASKYLDRNYQPFGTGGCTSIRKGGFLGRNFDWYYSELSEFIIHTPSKNGRYATVGMGGNSPKLTDDKVDSREYNPIYKVLPFFIVDGINEKGVAVSCNVVPHDKGHTSQSGGTKTDMSLLMIPRYILDYHETASAACYDIKDHFNIYAPENMELHFLIADAQDTYLIEFIENETVVTRLNDKEYQYITNFHMDGVAITDSAGSNILDWRTVEPYGNGLERFTYLLDNYSGTEETREGITSLLDNLKYTNTYTIDIDNDNFWKTEFAYKGGEYDFTIHSVKNSEPFRTFILNQIALYNEHKRNSKSWQTEHRSVYDIAERKLYLQTQEGVSGFEMVHEDELEICPTYEELKELKERVAFLENEIKKFVSYISEEPIVTEI